MQAMPVCPRCGAENADHMIACWRCASPIHPPQVADEIAKRRNKNAVKQLPPVTPETQVAAMSSEETVTAQEVATAMEELPTEPAMPTEAPLKPEAPTAAPVETQPPTPGKIAPSEKELTTAAQPVKEKPKALRVVPIALAAIIAIGAVGAAIFVLPRLFQSPRKVVNEFLSAVKVGDSERIKALVTNKDREKLEKLKGPSPYAPLQNVEFEVGEVTKQDSEVKVKVKFKITAPVKLEFEAPIICVREGLSWKIDGERTVMEVTGAALSAATKQWSAMIQEIMKKGIYGIPSPTPFAK